MTRSRLHRRLRRGLLALLALGGLLGVYATVVEPRLVLDEEHLTVRVPGLPAAWDGARVAVFADLQVGMWLSNDRMAERVVRRAVEADPAAVLYAGDFLYSTDADPAGQVAQVLDLLRPLLESGVPTYAVLGNHDYGAAAERPLEAALEDAGMEVLDNEAAPLVRAGEELYVVGVGPEEPERSDVAAALAGVPEDAARIVLMHNPTTFPDFPAGTAPLAVAGHTHCGQIAVPGLPDSWYPMLTDEEGSVARGWAHEGYGAPGNRLYVTCGVGFSLVPVRFNAPPQLVLVELRR